MVSNGVTREGLTEKGIHKQRSQGAEETTVQILEEERSLQGAQRELRVTWAGAGRGGHHGRRNRHPGNRHCGPSRDDFRKFQNKTHEINPLKKDIPLMIT